MLHVGVTSDTLSKPTGEQPLYILYHFQYSNAPTLDLIIMGDEERRKYTTVHIPTALAQLIDEILEDEEGAYSSRSEFMKDAIRRLLEYYGRYPKERENVKSHNRKILMSEEDFAAIVGRAKSESS